jgi:hypothetical protein
MPDYITYYTNFQLQRTYFLLGVFISLPIVHVKKSELIFNSQQVCDVVLGFELGLFRILWRYAMKYGSVVRFLLTRLIVTELLIF